MYKISVVIPMFKAKDYIDCCLDSIDRQGLSADEVEVLFIDDCSPDDTYNYAMKAAAGRTNVKILKQEKNGGPGKARNRGIEEATGEYVCFLDIDDMYVDGSFKEMYDAAKSVDADIYYSKAGSRKRNMEEDNMVDSTIIKFNGKAYLYLRMPHLVYDGISTNALLKNITQCYNGGNPVDEIATIFDEGNYQKKVMESSFYDEALQYYDEKLKEYPTDFRKEMKDDYFTYFFNEKIGQLSEADYKKFLKENGLTFGILLQASFVLAISKDLKKDKLIYRLFHSGRYNMMLDNMQGTEARPVLMLADFKNDERVVDFLQKLQYQYFESVYYDVVPFTEMVKRYPDIDSGIVFNYRGNLLGSTDIVLDGKPNSFSVLGYIYGSDSKDAGHSHDIFDMMLDKTSDGYAMSGNSGYYSKEEVLKIVEDMKVAFNLFLEKETIGQVLEAMDK